MCAPSTEDETQLRIHHEVVIDAPGRVWACVSDPDIVSTWWCPPPTVEVAFEAHEGGHFEERYDDGDFRYSLTGTVTTFVPEECLVITRETSGRFGGSDRIRVSLDHETPPVIVVLDHEFLELGEARWDEARAYYEAPWLDSLARLKRLAETGASR